MTTYETVLRMNSFRGSLKISRSDRAQSKGRSLTMRVDELASRLSSDDFGAKIRIFSSEVTL